MTGKFREIYLVRTEKKNMQRKRKQTRNYCFAKDVVVGAQRTTNSCNSIRKIYSIICI